MKSFKPKKKENLNNNNNNNNDNDNYKLNKKYQIKQNSLKEIHASDIIKNIQIIKIENSEGIKQRSFSVTEFFSDKLLFLQGGTNDFEILDTINLYNFEKNEWFSIENISREFSYLFFDKKIYGHKCLSINDTIVIYGGIEEKGYNKQVFIINKEDFSWDSANYSSCEYPLPRSFHSMNYDEENELIYIFGGWDANLLNFKGENFSSLWEFKLINSLSRQFFYYFFFVIFLLFFFMFFYLFFLLNKILFGLKISLWIKMDIKVI
jgi:hypothetical protein